MHYPVRRKERQISPEEARALFDAREYLVMATVGRDGAPYSVPLSYVVLDDTVYFHCATEGRKVANLAFCPKVSLTAVGSTQPVFDTSFSTYYESALVEGEARSVTDDGEKKKALLALAEKYLPEHMDKAEEYIAKSWNRTAVYAVSIDSVSGKAKRRPPASSPG